MVSQRLEIVATVWPSRWIVNSWLSRSPSISMSPAPPPGHRGITLSRTLSFLRPAGPGLREPGCGTFGPAFPGHSALGSPGPQGESQGGGCGNAGDSGQPPNAPVPPERAKQGGVKLLTGHFVGRANELGSLEPILDQLDRGCSAAIEVAGEPGIGKTRLLRELAARAAVRGHLVLSGAVSEFENDLPFSVFVDALDEYVAGLEPDRLAVLDHAVQAELAHVFPSLSALAGDQQVSPQHERYRSHRAVRALLEQLAQTRPLVLVLDDFHWADSASVELLGALLRRQPAAAVLTAVALRPRQTPERLAITLQRAHRSAAVIRVGLGALTLDEARQLLGERFDVARAALLYRESGGNPFYLEQLARSPARASQFTSAPEISLTGLDVPAAVAAALAEELTLLSEVGRLVLEGAAVAGDPFEPELAAAAAATSEAAAMHGVDELLRRDLIRTTDVPRRFRFRHPLVRRAVYQAAAGGWRLGAHERCAEALAARGASAAARAHHVERSARQGDLAAVAVLREAGEATARLAPESAARWFGGALRLLPQTAPAEDHVGLLLARSWALAAVGRFTDSHEAALEAVALVSGQPGALNTTVVTACASVERFLGRYELAHARLVRALRLLPEPASVERVELLIELTLNEFYRSRCDAMHDWAAPAVSAAIGTGDAALIAAAAVMPAFAAAMTGPTKIARSRHDQAAPLVDDLSDEELSLRPDAAGWLAIAEVYLDLYAEADAHASRALRLARASAHGDPLHRLYPVLPRVWYVRGKLAEATELLDGAIEAGRLLGSPPALAGNLFNRSVVALAVGDLDIALATAQESVELTHDLDEGFVAAWAAARLADVLLESGQPDRAAELLLGRAGGEEQALIPGGWRAYCLELLTRCWLALDRPAEAGRAATWAGRAAAAVALHAGDAARAAERGLAAAAAADQAGAPIEAALSRITAGRALARRGQPEPAVAELQRAAAALDACGARHYRDQAEQELGK